VRIVALASGGVDSSVMMLLLKKEGHDLLPLFIDYGQLAKKKEWEACQRICQYLDLKPCRMDISGFGMTIPSGITFGNLDIEKDAFLPTRNLLFLTLGASYGYIKSAYTIAIGLLSGPIFPDQTFEFVQIAQKSISMALGTDIRILAPLISLNKVDTLGLAHKYRLPLDLTYYCHSGDEEPCGRCISCKEYMMAQKYLQNKSS
jgi:7-cyano-7-deazaguanine synthase